MIGLYLLGVPFGIIAMLFEEFKAGTIESVNGNDIFVAAVLSWITVGKVALNMTGLSSYKPFAKKDEDVQ